MSRVTAPRRLLLGGLIAILVIFTLKAHGGAFWVLPRIGVDTESALLAADRWSSGGAPYNAAGFTAGPGVNQPFLYPPYTLPFFVALASLPRQPLLSGIVLLYLAISVACCRRLRIPWIWVPLALLWPPFSEGIVSANIGIPIFGAFVFLFYREGGSTWRPAPRDVAAPDESDARIGALATLQGAVKTSQPHAWLFILRRRPRAAILGAAALIVIAASTLLLTGFGPWFDWVSQLRLASDPTWDLGGIAVPRFLPPGVGLVVVAICVLGVWFVPRHDAGPAVGVLSVIGSLSLHTFGMLFLIPAMLVIRRELAIVAATFIATYSYEGSWGGIVVVAAAFVLATFGGPRVARWVREDAIGVPGEADVR